MKYQLFTSALNGLSIGNKAKNLMELYALGFNVPLGFVIPEAGPLDSEILSLIEKVGGFPVAVRSSGALEDLEGASFAGLYETFLNINSLNELTEAVKNCFESVNHPRVRDYFEHKGLDPKLARMSVIVQKQIQSKISGVLFTVHPLEGKEEEIYIECCEGLGERLVSGHVTPSSYKLHRDDSRILDYKINEEGTILEISILKELVECAINTQAHYGTPQDIEWAIDEWGKLWILQARPITEFKLRMDVPELTDSDLKDGGISARVCTPLMYSAYKLALEPSMSGYFQRIKLLPSQNIEWMYYFYGRAYWNAQAVKDGLAKLPDFNEEDFDRDLGILKDYGEQGPLKTKLTLESLIQAIPVLIHVWREFDDCQSMNAFFPSYFEGENERLLKTSKNLSKLGDRDFSDWLLEVFSFQRKTEMNYFRTIYNNTNYQGEFKRFVQKIQGTDEQTFVRLISGVGNIAHMEVQKGLVKLGQISDFYGFDSHKYYSEKQNFLREHYHHGPSELDLTVPRWGETPDMVDELVKYVAQTDSGSETYLEEVEKILSRTSLVQSYIFKRFIRRSHHFLKTREEFRTFSTMAYYLLRVGVVELSKRLGIDSHKLMMLKLEEIEPLLAMKKPLLSTQDKKLISHRWKVYQGWRNFKAPHEFGGRIKQSEILVNSEGKYKGLGCSPGIKTGTARVITSIEETQHLTKDDILVTLFTDPGWTPVLARVGGVVTEVGGILSHAAVIGREYKIPAILNLSGATQLIKDGQRISINGETGMVEILEESTKS